MKLSAKKTVALSLVFALFSLAVFLETFGTLFSDSMQGNLSTPFIQCLNLLSLLTFGVSVLTLTSLLVVYLFRVFTTHKI